MIPAHARLLARVDDKCRVGLFDNCRPSHHVTGGELLPVMNGRVDKTCGSLEVGATKCMRPRSSPATIVCINAVADVPAGSLHLSKVRRSRIPQNPGFVIQ